MHIPSSKLPQYFRGMTFPVQVLEEKSDRVAFSLSRAELGALAERGMVAATGTHTKVRKVRLTRPAERVASLRMKLAVWPIAEDNMTVTGPANRKRHHPGRTSAYARVVSQGVTYSAEDCPWEMRVAVDGASV